MEQSEIISYIEMCQREGLSLQKGMNFGDGKRASIILMSRRPGAPYEDAITDDGRTLIYQGHDIPKTASTLNPKIVNQELLLPSGKFSENGKFKNAADKYKEGMRPAEKVKVYEKIRDGIWSYNGLFALEDAWAEQAERRTVFRFRLTILGAEHVSAEGSSMEIGHARIIPSQVKQAVWKRDKGKCVECGATDNLHFDHIIPFSKGGSSLTESNVQLLCFRHNIAKRDQIL